MTYNEFMQTVRNSEPDQWIEHDTEGVHTFRGDLNIRIERQNSTRDNDQFHEAWAQKHADPSTSRQYYGIYYGASLVEKFMLVAVDGGRASLPLPRAQTTVIPFADYQIARVVAENRLDEYIERSGLTVEKPEPFKNNIMLAAEMQEN